MIQELTSLVTSIHGKPYSTQTSSKQSESKLKSTGNKSDVMDIDKDSNKIKDPHTSRQVHRKTRTTSNIE